jgi:hypothetical protein
VNLTVTPDGTLTKQNRDRLLAHRRAVAPFVLRFDRTGFTGAIVADGSS